MVLGLTGGASIHAAAVQKGLELAKDELVQSGWNVELVYEDDQTQSPRTVSAFQSLIARGFKLFVGPLWDFQIIAARPVLKANNALTMAVTASTDAGGGPGAGVFFMVPPRTWQLKPLQNVISDKKWHRAYVLVPDFLWGHVHKKVFVDATVASGGQVVGSEFYDYGLQVSQLTSILARIRSKNPDVLLITGAGADVANIISARNRLGMKVAIVATDTAWDVLDDRLLTASEVENVYVSEIAQNERFIKLYETKYGTRPRSYADSAYDALMIYAKAVSETDGTSVEIGRYLNEKCDFDGMSGRKRFDANGDVQDGEYRVVPLKERG